MALGRPAGRTLRARGGIGAARDGCRADPQVHPEPAETRAGGRAPAQRRICRRGGRQQSAAAAGECGASSAPPRAPWAARDPEPGLREQPARPCPCCFPLSSPTLPSAPPLLVPLAPPTREDLGAFGDLGHSEEQLRGQQKRSVGEDVSGFEAVGRWRECMAGR